MNWCQSKAFEWCTIVLLVPCEICGIFGFIVAGLYLVLALPIVVIVLAFYCLPTVSLTLRLLAHFFIYMTPTSGTCCGRELFITLKKKCNVIFTMFSNIPKMQYLFLIISLILEKNVKVNLIRYPSAQKHHN
jgi:hypothetical protein